MCVGVVQNVLSKNPRPILQLLETVQSLYLDPVCRGFHGRFRFLASCPVESQQENSEIHEIHEIHEHLGTDSGLPPDLWVLYAKTGGEAVGGSKAALGTQRNCQDPLIAAPLRNHGTQKL